MTISFGAKSILEQKASKLNVSLQKADVNVRLGVYLETLIDLEDFLDTGDLGKLTKSGMTFIIKDVLSIISGLRSIESESQGLAPLLEELRNARDELQIANELYKNEIVAIPSKYFTTLRSCRSSLRAAIFLLQHTQGFSGDITTNTLVNSRLAGDETTDAPPPDDTKKKRKGK